MIDAQSPSHRERKKQRTRRSIEAAAFRLFEQRGFQATTLAEIAGAADVAPRTFFGYFSSKEAVVFSDSDAAYETLARRLRHRGDGESTFEALRAFILEHGAADRGDSRGYEALRRRLIAGSDALAARERQLMMRFERLIGESVAVDLGDHPGSLRPRLVAAAAVAALAAMQPGCDDQSSKWIDDEKIARLDDAFAFLRGGIAALEVRGAETAAPLR